MSTQETQLMVQSAFMTPQLTLYLPEFASVRLIECSPPSWMVQLVLAEKGIAYDERPLSFAKGEHRTPHMLTLNPRGTIPVVTHGEAVLKEMLAIVEYLEMMHPEPPLMPSERVANALALDRLHESAQLKTAGMRLFAALMRAPDHKGDEPEIMAMQQTFHDELQWWETYAQQAPWLAGNAMSLADLSVFVYVATAVQLGLKLADRYGALERWYARMRGRASVQNKWPTTWIKTRNVLAD